MSKAKKNESVEAEKPTGEVIFLETFTEIPKPKYTLKKAGRTTYDDRCKALIATGDLTVKTLDLVLMLAVAADQIENAIQNGGKNMRAASEMQRAAMLKLDKFDADKQIASPGQGSNTFSRFGFARKAWERRHSID